MRVNTYTCINSTRGASSYHSYHLRMYLWWIVCTLYLHACQVRVTVGDLGLCCCTCVTYFKCYLTPRSVDCQKACLKRTVLSWVLNSEWGSFFFFLQTGRQCIPDRRSIETERVITKRYKIMFWNFQKHLAWRSEGARCTVVSEAVVQ